MWAAKRAWSGQNDQQSESLSGQMVILVRHCPLTSCYFEPRLAGVFLRAGHQEKLPAINVTFASISSQRTFFNTRNNKNELYTCQLSRLRRESHACGLKTSISRQLTLAGQFLTPDWKMWVVAVLLDTISKNMLTQTHVRNENHV